MSEADKKKAAEAQAKFEKEMKEYQEQQSKNEGLQTAFSAGMEAAKAQNWTAAIEGFTKASELDPTQHAVFGQLADVYQKRAEKSKGAERLADCREIRRDLRQGDCHHPDRCGLSLQLLRRPGSLE